MRRRTLLASSVAPVCFMVEACSRPRPRKLMTVRAAVPPILTMCPFYAGYEAGYFSEAGFDVEIAKESPGVQLIAPLAGGKLDVGFPGLSSGLMNAIARGARVRVVAGREISSRGCNMHARIYVSSREFPNGIPSMQVLRHRKIAVSAGSSIALFCLDKILEHSGMSRADVQIVPTGTSERIAALRAGGVSAFLSGAADLNPMLRDLQIAPGPSIADILPNFQYSCIAFGPRLLDGDIRTGTSFLKAYFRGARDFLAGKTPAFMDEYARANNLDPKLVRAGCRDSFEPEGKIHLTDLQLAIDWSLENGYLHQRISAQSMVDTRFLDAMQRT